jgi:hypothetical protein
VHQGFDDWREVTTDRNGEAELTAPIYPLFLDHTFYDEAQRPGGRSLVPQRGERLEGAAEHTLRHVWDREPNRTFRLHIRRADGAPGRGALYAREGYGCDAGATELGVADARGDLIATFALEHATELFLGRADREPRDDDSLTEDEISTLNQSGEVSIVWPRQDR